MTQVTTADIRTRIKDMILGDTTIGAIPNVHVFDKAPMTLQRAYLPAIIITDGNGTYDHNSMGNRFVKPTMNYTIALYMQEWVANPDINIDADGIDAITTALEDLTVENHRMEYQGAPLKGVSSAQLTNVTLIAPRTYPVGTQGQLYVHKQWTYQVIYNRKT